MVNSKKRSKEARSKKQRLESSGAIYRTREAVSLKKKRQRGREVKMQRKIYDGNIPISLLLVSLLLTSYILLLVSYFLQLERGERERYPLYASFLTGCEE